MKFKISLIFMLSMVGISPAYAQDTFRIEEAIQKGLEKNFAIQVARNQAQIATNNNTFVIRFSSSSNCRWNN